MTDSQFDRADRAAAAEGTTFQSFAVAAIMRSIEEAEGRQDIVRERKQAARRGFGMSAAGKHTPGGLGIAASRTPHEEPFGPSLAPAPVVVNVGQTTPHPDDIVERMAKYVLAGDEFDRPMRLQSAVDMLAASTTDESQRESLARRLDETIAARSAPARVQGVMKTTLESLKEWLP